MKSTELETLNREQLRRVADYLYDGEPSVLHLMSQVRQFRKGDHVLLWLCRNQIRGQKMIEFFKDVSGKDESRGVMRGVQKALDYIEGRKGHTQKLTVEDLK